MMTDGARFFSVIYKDKIISFSEHDIVILRVSQIWKVSSIDS